MFGPNDPVHMGTLHIAFLSEFRAATLEGKYPYFFGFKNLRAKLTGRVTFSF